MVAFKNCIAVWQNNIIYLSVQYLQVVQRIIFCCSAYKKLFNSFFYDNNENDSFNAIQLVNILEFSNFTKKETFKNLL